jgi:hypothetical protein
MNSLPPHGSREALRARIATLLAPGEPEPVGRAQVLPEDAAIGITAARGSRTFAKSREERAERTAALQAIRPGVRITPDGQAKQKRPVSHAENVAQARARLLSLPPDELLEVQSSGALDRLSAHKAEIYRDALAEIADEQTSELAADTTGFFSHLVPEELEAQLDSAAPAEEEAEGWDGEDDWVADLVGYEDEESGA